MIKEYIFDIDLYCGLFQNDRELEKQLSFKDMLIQIIKIGIKDYDYIFDKESDFYSLHLLLSKSFIINELYPYFDNKSLTYYQTYTNPIYPTIY